MKNPTKFYEFGHTSTEQADARTILQRLCAAVLFYSTVFSIHVAMVSKTKHATNSQNDKPNCTTGKTLSYYIRYRYIM